MWNIDSRDARGIAGEPSPVDDHWSTKDAAVEDHVRCMMHAGA